MSETPLKIVIITGPPCSGKTVLGGLLAQTLRDRNIPTYWHDQDLQEGNRAVYRALLDLVKNSIFIRIIPRFFEESKAAVQEIAKTSRPVFLDSLNEIIIHTLGQNLNAVVTANLKKGDYPFFEKTCTAISAYIGRDVELISVHLEPDPVGILLSLQTRDLDVDRRDFLADTAELHAAITEFGKHGSVSSGDSTQRNFEQIILNPFIDGNQGDEGRKAPGVLVEECLAQMEKCGGVLIKPNRDLPKPLLTQYRDRVLNPILPHFTK